MAGRDYMERARDAAFTEAATAALLITSFEVLEHIGQVYERERPRLPECIQDVPVLPAPEPVREPEAAPKPPTGHLAYGPGVTGGPTNRMHVTFIDPCGSCGGWGWAGPDGLCPRCDGRGRMS